MLFLLIVTAGELKKITEYMHFDEVETSKIGHYWHICNQKLTNPCMGDAKEGDHYSCLGSSIPKFSWNLQGRGFFFSMLPLPYMVCMNTYERSRSGQQYNNLSPFPLEQASRPLKSYHWVRWDCVKLTDFGGYLLQTPK